MLASFYVRLTELFWILLRASASRTCGFRIVMACLVWSNRKELEAARTVEPKRYCCAMVLGGKTASLMQTLPSAPFYPTLRIVFVRVWYVCVFFSLPSTAPARVCMCVSYFFC